MKSGNITEKYNMNTEIYEGVIKTIRILTITSDSDILRVHDHKFKSNQ